MSQFQTQLIIKLQPIDQIRYIAFSTYVYEFWRYIGLQGRIKVFRSPVAPPRVIILFGNDEYDGAYPLVNTSSSAVADRSRALRVCQYSFNSITPRAQSLFMPRPRREGAIIAFVRPSVCLSIRRVIIIIIIISTTMFMVLSSWQSHCESSPGSFDECRMAPSGRRPQTKPDDLGCESAYTGCQKLHPPSPFIITQPES